LPAQARQQLLKNCTQPITSPFSTLGGGGGPKSAKQAWAAARVLKVTTIAAALVIAELDSCRDTREFLRAANSLVVVFLEAAAAVAEVVTWPS
jgi:hypothetical protein